MHMLLRVCGETVHVSATYIFFLLGDGVEGGASSGPTPLPSSFSLSFLQKEKVYGVYILALHRNTALVL